MILEVVAALLLGALVLWVVLEPLYRPETVGPAFEEPEDPEETRRGIALLALKEIDFDRATGKLSDVDYEFLRQRYTVEALQAIKEEEGQGAASGSGSALASLRCTACGAQPAPDALFCSECGTPLARPGQCRGCRAELEAGARFCSDCGTPVAA
jgi:hypothetical protein